MFEKKDFYLPHVDGLRALAVLAVLLFHYDCQYVKGGFVGVDVFFVISGYLITRLIVSEISHTGTFSFSYFYYRRILRIVPALCGVLVLTWFFCVLLFSPGHLRAFGASMSTAALSLSNCYFWRQVGYFDVGAEFKPLLHTWSLGVEEQFYLIWPLFIVVVTKWSKRWVPVAIIITGITSLLLNIIFQKSHLNALYYLMPFRFFEFCIGAILIWCQSDTENKLMLNVMAMLGFISLIYSIICFDERMVFPSYNALIPCVAAALIIYGGKKTYVGALFSNQVVVRIGLISYSLYLVHWPIIVFYKYLVPNAIIDFNVKIMLIMLCFCLAILMYRLVEQPFRLKRVANKSQQTRGALKWSSGLVTLSAIGLLIHFSQGWLWRVPDLKDGPFSDKHWVEDYHKIFFGGAGFDYPFGWTYKAKNDAADIVLMGDSHAQMLQHGLVKEIAKPFNKSIYMAGSSCLILPQTYRNTVGTDWKTICPNVLHTALKKLFEKEDSILILSEAWSFQIPNAVDLITNNLLDIDLNSSNPSYYKPLLDKLVLLRKLIGKRTLIILGDVPGSGLDDSFSCLTRPLFARKYCKNQLSIAQQKNSPSININKILQQFATASAKTYFINPYNSFCKNGICTALNERGEPFYSDKAHLSQTGSDFLIASIKPKIKSILNLEQDFA